MNKGAAGIIAVGLFADDAILVPENKKRLYKHVEANRKRGEKCNVCGARSRSIAVQLVKRIHIASICRQHAAVAGGGSTLLYFTCTEMRPGRPNAAGD